MTIRECTMAICLEIGMSEEEAARFIRDQDSGATPENLHEVNTRTVEALGPNQNVFWSLMRRDVKIMVESWREETRKRELQGPQDQRKRSATA